jgi:hypothetical protein
MKKAGETHNSSRHHSLPTTNFLRDGDTSLKLCEPNPVRLPSPMKVLAKKGAVDCVLPAGFERELGVTKTRLFPEIMRFVPSGWRHARSGRSRAVDYEML